MVKLAANPFDPAWNDYYEARRRAQKGGTFCSVAGAKGSTTSHGPML
jgi:hypothetical protein